MTRRKPHARKNLGAFLLDLLGVAVILTAISYDLFADGPVSIRFGILQISASIFGILATLISSYLVPLPRKWHEIAIPKFPSFFVFMFSLMLMGINVVGLLIPQRNPQVYQGIEYAGINRVAKYPARQVIEQMDRADASDEQFPEYVKRLTRLVFEGTVHHWDEEKDGNSFHLYIPLHENYLIYLYRVVHGIDAPYEFCRAERAIARAASVCSQSAKILTNILTRNKVKAQIISLDGHVIVRAKVEKKPETWWILDADFGVVIEQDIDAIASNPEI